MRERERWKRKVKRYKEGGKADGEAGLTRSKKRGFPTHPRFLLGLVP
jgi:hypothetical protein